MLIGDKKVFGNLGHKGIKEYKSSKNSTYNSLIQSKKKEKENMHLQLRVVD
jgi:hypothetical protein